MIETKLPFSTSGIRIVLNILSYCQAHKGIKFWMVTWKKNTLQPSLKKNNFKETQFHFELKNKIAVNLQASMFVNSEVFGMSLLHK